MVVYEIKCGRKICLFVDFYFRTNINHTGGTAQHKICNVRASENLVEFEIKHLITWLGFQWNVVTAKKKKNEKKHQKQCFSNKRQVLISYLIFDNGCDIFILFLFRVFCFPFWIKFSTLHIHMTVMFGLRYQNGKPMPAFYKMRK